MKIYLIRHGQTTGDIEGRYGGDYDDRLTEKGKRQAGELALKLVGFNIEKIFSSPRIRAKETSEILKEELGCNIEIIEDLRERNRYGVMTGMIKSEAKARYPYLVEMLNDTKKTIDGGEAYEPFKERVRGAFSEVLRGDYKNIAIVSHGGPIRLIFREILNYGEVDIDDCAFAILEASGDKIEIINLDGIEKKLQKPS